MTLIQLGDERKTTILIDMCIRQGCDKPENGMCDVNEELRKRLPVNAKGRPYVDVFMLTHPDQDHCNGASENLHLGPLADYVDNPTEGKPKKILVKEMWSSPLIFRRASKNHTLCDDACAIQAEARRRVNLYKERRYFAEGDRIRVIGEDVKDENGKSKTDEILEIVSRVDDRFTAVNGAETGRIEMYVLAPLPPSDDEAEEDVLSKNNSSIIMRFWIKEYAYGADGCKLLTGGDAEVEIWERLRRKYELERQDQEPLQYDLLIAPHHCSWGVLSHDPAGTDSEVSPEARWALSQTRRGAIIVASSDPIDDDGDDPPCYDAKLEYEDIAKDAQGEFYCTGEHPNRQKPQPLEFLVTSNGPVAPARKAVAVTLAAAGAKPVLHGDG